MSKHFSAEEKMQLLQRVHAGESITAICKAKGISRTILYTWMKAYEHTSPKVLHTVLRPKHPSGQKHYRAIESSMSKRIIKLARQHPEYSFRTLAQGIGVSRTYVYKILKQRGMLTKEAREQSTSSKKQLPAEEKEKIITRFVAGEPITLLCQEYHISSVIFYRWLRNYENKSHLKEALEKKHPKGEQHWRYNKRARKLILALVSEHPEYGVHRISRVLEEQTGKKVFSHHGVHVFLKHLHLNTPKQRIAFATLPISERKAWGLSF